MTNKIAPGGDAMSDASSQAAQQMVAAAKIAKAVQDATNPAGAAGAPRMQFAAQKIVHTPETPADYAKRVKEDKDLRNLKMPERDK